MKKLTLNDLKALDLEALYKVSVALDKATDIKDDAKRHAAEREFFADGEWQACIKYIVNHKDLHAKRTAKSRAKTAAMTRALVDYDYSKVSVCSEFC